MPTYKVTDPTTGKVARLTGDSPPSEQEISEVFSSHPTLTGLAGATQRIMQPAKDYLADNFKNLNNSAPGKVVRWGAEAALNIPESAAGIVDGMAGQVTGLGEKVAKHGILRPDLALGEQAVEMGKGMAGYAGNVIAHPIQSLHDDPVGTVLLGKGAKAAAKPVASAAKAVPKAIAKKVMDPPETMLRGSVRYLDRVSDKDIAGATLEQLKAGGDVTPAGKANLIAEKNRAGAAKQEFIEAGTSSGQQVPSSGMYAAIDDFVKSKQGKLSADDLAAVERARDLVTSIVDPSAKPGAIASGNIPIAQLDKLKQALQNTNRERYVVGANPKTGQAVEMAVADWAKKSVEQLQPDIAIPNKAYHDLTNSVRAVSKRLRQLENAGVVSGNLAMDIAKQIPGSISHFFGFGRGALSPAEFSGLLQRPDIRSRVAVKMDKWLNDRQPTQYPKPPTPPAPPVTGGPTPLPPAPATVTPPVAPIPAAPPAGTPPAGGAAPIAPPQSGGFSAESIPADLEIPITVIRGKTGKQVTFKMNARQALLDSLADVATIKAAMGGGP